MYESHPYISGMYSWRASLQATIAGAVSGVALLTLIAAWQRGFDGETLFFMVGIALPVALLVAAPVGFIVFPAARFVMDKLEAYTASRLMMVGAVMGFVLPLLAAWRLRAHFVVSGSWAVTVIFVVAATVAGAISAFAYHRRTEPQPGRPV
jgi:hypothetical protein